jgi:hypothetical protein
VVLVGLLAGSAAAQTGAEAKAAADAAYQKGKALQDAGNCADAIDQFAKSQELDPQLGTQYNLALCYQDVGRIASAWIELSELAAKDTNKKRKADAAKRAKALEPKLTRMAITVAEPVDGLRITRDGVDVTALIDVETPVDPSVSTFEATAPGHQPWRAELDLTAPGATVTVEVPALDPTPEVIDDDGGAIAERPDRSEPTRVWSDPGKGRRRLGMVITGVGVIAAGVGAVFGFQAKGLNDDAIAACGGDVDPCFGDQDAAAQLIADARGKATLSNIFVGAGLAATVVGVALWITAPDKVELRSASIVPVAGGGLGVAYDGRW